MRPDDFSLLYQDTDAAPWDMGSCGSQTTFNSVRVLAATDEVRDQLLDNAAEHPRGGAATSSLRRGGAREGRPRRR